MLLLKNQNTGRSKTGTGSEIPSNFICSAYLNDPEPNMGKV
jgi:hypothetical protein